MRAHGRRASRRAPEEAGRRLLAAGLVALLAAACVGIPRTVALHYPPRIAPATFAPPALTAPVSTAALDDVTDHRHPHRRERIGEERNGLGFHLRYFEVEGSLEDWLRTGIEVELSRAGFRLDEGADARGTRIDVRLRKLFAPRQHFQQASIELDAFLYCTCHGKVLLSRSYAADVSLEGEADHGPAEALARALQRVGSELAAAAARHDGCGTF